MVVGVVPALRAVWEEGNAGESWPQFHKTTGKNAGPGSVVAAHARKEADDGRARGEGRIPGENQDAPACECSARHDVCGRDGACAPRDVTPSLGTKGDGSRADTDRVPFAIFWPIG